MILPLSWRFDSRLFVLRLSWPVESERLVEESVLPVAALVGFSVASYRKPVVLFASQFVQCC